MTRKDPVSKAWSEALHLVFDGVGHVDRRSVRDVAIGVTGLLSLRRSRRVELALLTEDEIGTLRVAPSVHVALGCADLLERSTDVDRRGLETSGVLPRDGTVERPVELEDPGAVAIASQPASVAVGQGVARDARELLGGGVEEDDTGGRQLFQALDAPAGLDTTAQALEMRRQRTRNRLRSTLRHRPVHHVARHREEESERRREW